MVNIASNQINTNVAPPQTRKHKFEILRVLLDNERSSFRPHWRDLSDFILPRRSRFFVQDTNRGERRSQRIIDTTATLAARTLRSGMMAGITSPARQWFRLASPFPRLNESPAVKSWAHETTIRMLEVMLRSNIYRALGTFYGDMATFGTSCMMLEEDFETVFRATTFPIGSFMIANDEKLKVNTFYRDFQMTIRQIVDFFLRTRPEDQGFIDWSLASERIRSMWNNSQTEIKIDMVHVIMPNQDWRPERAESQFKKWISAYYERATNSRNAQSVVSLNLEDKFLSLSGFDMFPVLAGRWEVTGEDTYASSCPGMDSLGDIRQLQKMELRGLQAVEKHVNPPMTGPTSLRSTGASIMPGVTTFADTQSGQGGFRPSHEVTPRIQELEIKQQQTRERIRRGYFEDLFLMFASTDRREITATEIAERKEEKLLALGPMLEQLNQDVLDPLIDLVFEFMLRQGLVPEPPPELEGIKLKVEYVSIMAQAQKLLGLSSMERLAQVTGQIATFNPGILQKVDFDNWMDEYADVLSIPPDVIVPNETVQQIREAQAQAQQQQAAAEQAALAAKSAENLGKASTQEGNALGDLLAASEANQSVTGEVPAQ